MNPSPLLGRGEDEGRFPISVVILAKNEEKRIAEAIRSVAWTKEILVIDDESTDRTVEIATAEGARVIHRAMDIEGRQRNFGCEQATQPWILSLDADERVSLELAEEIKQRIETHSENPEIVGFDFRVRTYIGSQWVRGAGYYPSRRTKLFRKGRLRYEEEKIHPRVFYEGKVILLKNDLLHYSCRDLGDFIRKFNRETTLEAEKWIRDGRKVSLPRTLRKMADRFLKNYFLKEGWRHGVMGYTMSVFHSFYQLVTYAKYREIKGGRGRLAGEGAKRDRVVFVDRDGVLNEDLLDYVKDWKDFRFQEGVFPGLRRLSEAGYKIILISNQAGVGDGVFPETAHWEIHRRMLDALEKGGIRLAESYYCLHGKKSGCDCRKPKTGLFKRAAQNGFHFDKSETYFVGDKVTDIEAGKNFGLRTILVRTGYGDRHEALCQGNLLPDKVVNNFQEAVDHLLCA